MGQLHGFLAAADRCSQSRCVAIILSAVHLVNGFQLLTAVSTFIVGIVLAVLAVRTKRLGAGIVAHIVYNATLIAMSELAGM